jgi:hypothetical protein
MRTVATKSEHYSFWQFSKRFVNFLVNVALPLGLSVASQALVKPFVSGKYSTVFADCILCSGVNWLSVVANRLELRHTAS